MGHLSLLYLIIEVTVFQVNSYVHVVQCDQCLLAARESTNSNPVKINHLFQTIALELTISRRFVNEKPLILFLNRITKSRTISFFLTVENSLHLQFLYLKNN